MTIIENNELKEHLKKYTAPKCISCNIFSYRDANKLCIYCNPNSKKLYATKEMKVVTFLKNNNIEFIHNKSIGFECGNYRPDILIDCNTHFIVVECDENQHEGYNKNCEMARMNNIYISLGLPVVYLRYNPDKFIHNEINKKINSKKRLNYLLERIKYYQEQNIKEPIIIEKLFYDKKEDDNIFSEIIIFSINI